MGLDYIGEVEIEQGKSIHSKLERASLSYTFSSANTLVRCHKASATAPAYLHSIDTRPGSEGGAIFKTGEELKWFDY